MAAPRKYPNELRKRAIRLVLEAKKDLDSAAGACRRIGEQLGVNTNVGLAEPILQRRFADTEVGSDLLDSDAARARRRPRGNLGDRDRE